MKKVISEEIYKIQRKNYPTTVGVLSLHRSRGTSIITGDNIIGFIKRTISEFERLDYYGNNHRMTCEKFMLSSCQIYSFTYNSWQMLSKQEYDFMKEKFSTTRINDESDIFKYVMMSELIR